MNKILIRAFLMVFLFIHQFAGAGDSERMQTQLQALESKVKLSKEVELLISAFSEVLIDEINDRGTKRVQLQQLNQHLKTNYFSNENDHNVKSNSKRSKRVPASGQDNEAKGPEVTEQQFLSLKNELELAVRDFNIQIDSLRQTISDLKEENRILKSQIEAQMRELEVTTTKGIETLIKNSESEMSKVSRLEEHANISIIDEFDSLSENKKTFVEAGRKKLTKKIMAYHVLSTGKIAYAPTNLQLALKSSASIQSVIPVIPSGPIQAATAATLGLKSWKRNIKARNTFDTIPPDMRDTFAFNLFVKLSKHFSEPNKNENVNFQKLGEKVAEIAENYIKSGRLLGLLEFLKDENTIGRYNIVVGYFSKIIINYFLELDERESISIKTTGDYVEKVKQILDQKQPYVLMRDLISIDDVINTLFEKKKPFQLKLVKGQYFSPIEWGSFCAIQRTPSFFIAKNTENLGSKIVDSKKRYLSAHSGIFDLHFDTKEGTYFRFEVVGNGLFRIMADSPKDKNLIGKGWKFWPNIRLAKLVRENSIAFKIQTFVDP